MVQQHADTPVWLHPSFTSEHVQTLFFFSTRPQGAYEKFGVCMERRLGCDLHIYHSMTIHGP